MYSSQFRTVVQAAHPFYILPDGSFVTGVAQQRRRVIGDDEGDTLVLVQLSPQSRQRRLCLQQGVSGVAVLADGVIEAGGHEAVVAPGALAAGTYVVRMQAGAFSATTRLTVVR